LHATPRREKKDFITREKGGPEKRKGGHHLEQVGERGNEGSEKGIQPGIEDKGKEKGKGWQRSTRLRREEGPRIKADKASG